MCHNMAFLQTVLLNKKSSRPDGLQLYERETPAQMFSCEYCEIFKNSFFYRTPTVVAFGSQRI